MKNLLLLLGLVAVLIIVGLAVRLGGISAPSREEEYNAGNLDQLIQRASDDIASNPSDVQALLALATTYAMKGSVRFAEEDNGAKAIEFADKVIALDPNNSEAYRIRGYAFEIQERYPEAHASYDKAIELNTQNFQALSNKGHAYDLQGDNEKADELYRRSLTVEPQGEHALLNYSRSLFRQKKYDESRANLEKLLSVTKNLRFKAEAYQLLAEIYRTQADYTAARAAIEKCTEIDPNMPQAWVSRGRIRLNAVFEVSNDAQREALVQEIAAYAQKALALNPNQATAYALLADAMLIKNDEARAVDYKQQALTAIDRDITLGQRERESFRSVLLAEVTSR